jgi:heme exporter protein A
MNKQGDVLAAILNNNHSRPNDSLQYQSREQDVPQTFAIEVQSLKKSYGFKPILRRVDLTLPVGQRMALLGANGAGKTTLLRILAGLNKASSGTVKIEGLDSKDDAQEIRSRIGFVAHQPYLYDELTILENLLFFGRMYSVRDARERALYLLRRVSLERRMNERVSTLSRGQTQRLAWARALLHRPSLLLLDEPDTGLDQEGNDLIDELLAEHTVGGGSVLFTTHVLERALRLSNQLLILRGGRVVYQNETASLTLDELHRVYREVVK